ncbi:class IV lanthionine synthetase LanL [Actinophytocola xanthii]|uniref:non-specific serine/threonine protein kinase n=1 Tax=Actinophytocola xanthii TaxID=1912961 RepID=A0A1Q8CK85_9PSEU|nr:class IV lanthionine synthetase LanL [Actinophytocola xanthii]OLF14749.1 hypothetical protein BU204_25405 [Actinophytocola xanthii]
MSVDDLLLTDCAAAALARADLPGWRLNLGDFWCYVEPAAGRTRAQGWKLHVSATPLSAPAVLARSAEVLLAHGCPFKFAAGLAQVAELGHRQADRAGGGKFLTAYPDRGPYEFRELAEALHRATEGLPGPGVLSDRRYRPGSLVHYRFGAFGGVRMLGNDGVYESMLVHPDGSLVQDRRTAWFSPPSWAPPDPFGHTRPAATRRSVLLNGRYLVREVIRHAFTGGVFRAVDQETGAEVIVKQARPHAGATLAGTDALDQRRHEAAMLELFAESGYTPRLLDVFEQQGEVMLVLESVPGTTLRQWVRDRGGRDGVPWRETALGLVNLLTLVHGRGLVVRDFTPNNIMVTPEGGVRLVDLELLAEPGTCVVRGHTPGYGAPEQVRAASPGPAPSPAADLFSLGATLFYLASGADPVLCADEPPARAIAERVGSWLGRLERDSVVARRLAPVVVALMHEEPDRRPDLAAVRDHLTRAEPAEPLPVSGSPPRAIDGDALDRLITDGFGHLLDTMRPDDSSGRLWPSGDFGATTDPLNVQHGAAGVLGALIAGCRAGLDLTDAVAGTAAWIARRAPREPRVLPGLHFGRSGTAWALLDAATILGDEELARTARDLASRVPVRWPNPDVCHGMAGAGLTQLRFWEVTGDDEFLARARTVAENLAAAVGRHDDGAVHWPIPRDFESTMAGMSHHGFAHGTAGVGTFLLAMAELTDESAYLDLATAAADTLSAAVQRDRGAAYWPSRVGGGPPKTNWCSGSSGVGTFLARMWRHSHDDRYGELAGAAGLAVRRSRWHAGLSQCHGLAGDGDFLLDLAEITGDDRYRDWAAELAVSFSVRAALRHGRMVVPDETGIAVVADFGTGLSGALTFLLRLRGGGLRPWLPEVLASDRAPAAST